MSAGPAPTCRLRHGTVPAELFVPPSAEARFLLRHAAWLVSPADGRGGPLSRLLRMALVAPFTQLTFVSFDLQAFLFDVFHTTRVARVGHFAFMATFNFCLLTALASLHPVAALTYAIVLLGWYAVVAASVRLWAWFAAMVVVVVAMYLGATALSAWLPRHAPWFDPWLGALGSAVLIALSHAPEPDLPPRAVPGERWQSIAAFVAGAPTWPLRLRNAGRVTLFLLWGTLDEAWAAPRLLPYNVLMLMFDLGYAPALRARLRERVARAQASGNPALDYVGIGGATFLALDEAA